MHYKTYHHLISLNRYSSLKLNTNKGVILKLFIKSCFHHIKIHTIKSINNIVKDFPLNNNFYKILLTNRSFLNFLILFCLIKLLSFIDILKLNFLLLLKTQIQCLLLYLASNLNHSNIQLYF